MIVKPCAKATATIPDKPRPVPTTAAALAPINTNEKVPMNSARSLDAIPLGMDDSGDEMTCRCDQVALRKDTLVGVADGAQERRRLANASRPTRRRPSAV